MIRTFSLILASMSFIIVIGGAVYEHAGVVPVWSSAVPASLAMFQGEFAITPGYFWIPIHPLTLLLMGTALFLNWRTERRKFILATLVGYALVLTTTWIYFVPELLTLTQTPYSPTVDLDLTRRANLWENLSLIRLAVLIGLACSILWGLSRSEEVGVAGIE